MRLTDDLAEVLDYLATAIARELRREPLAVWTKTADEPEPEPEPEPAQDDDVPTLEQIRAECFGQNTL